VISYSKKVTLRDCGLIEACRKRFYPGGFNWEKNVGGDAKRGEEEQEIIRKHLACQFIQFKIQDNICDYF